MTPNIQNSRAQIGFSHAVEEIYDHYSPAGRLQTEVKAQAQVFCDPNAPAEELGESVKFFAAYAENGSYQSPSGTITDFNNKDLAKPLSDLKTLLAPVFNSIGITVPNTSDSLEQEPWPGAAAWEEQQGDSPDTMVLNNPCGAPATLADLSNYLGRAPNPSDSFFTDRMAYSSDSIGLHVLDTAPGLTKTETDGWHTHKYYSGLAKDFLNYMMFNRTSVPAYPLGSYNVN